MSATLLFCCEPANSCQRQQCEKSPVKERRKCGAFSLIFWRTGWVGFSPKHGSAAFLTGWCSSAGAGGLGASGLGLLWGSGVQGATRFETWKYWEMGKNQRNTWSWNLEEVVRKSICRQCMYKGEKKEFAKKLAEKSIQSRWWGRGLSFHCQQQCVSVGKQFLKLDQSEKSAVQHFFTPSNPSKISTLVVQANFWHFLFCHFWNCWMLIPSAFVTLSILMVIMARFWYFYYCGTQSICFVLLIFLPQFAFLT